MAKRPGIKGNEDLDKDEEVETEKEPASASADDDAAQNPSQLQPYPTGNPPDPEDEFERMHGFRRAPAKESK